MTIAKNLTKFSLTFVACLIAGFVTSQDIHASCDIHGPEGKRVSANQDVLVRILNETSVCPENALQLRNSLLIGGLRLSPTLVANRGFHNPSQGSFSIFEMVTGSLKELKITVRQGDFFFGHFVTGNSKGLLVPEQAPSAGSLMVEAIVADSLKGFYNFYELRGDGKKGVWFYRGDTADIFADLKNLHRSTNPNAPVFGNRLRCSGCHLNGGPIMKEISAPHNDWWTVERKLDFGGYVPDSNLIPIFKNLVSGERLATDVKVGLERLEISPRFQELRSTRSLQEKLRPLFCPVELNIASDPFPNSPDSARIMIPLESLIDLRLLPPQDRPVVSFDRGFYLQILEQFKSSFPENGYPDSDHPWLTPVKALSDYLAVSSLVKQGLVDQNFVAAVLGVDLTNPLFSEGRCGLLKLIPNDSTNWKAILVGRLRSNSGWPAKELLANLIEPGRNIKFQSMRARAFIHNCIERLQTRAGVTDLFQVMRQRRIEIKASEISKNPKGQILEPGFRVIFPETFPIPVPGFLGLNEKCFLHRYLTPVSQLNLR